MRKVYGIRRDGGVPGFAGSLTSFYPKRPEI
jgi:hypothetical protein